MKNSIALPGTIVWFTDSRPRELIERIPSQRGEIVSRLDSNDHVQVELADGSTIWCNPQCLEQLRD